LKPISLRRKKIDIPILVKYGEDDQVVPIKVTGGLKAARLIRGAKEIY